MNFDIIIQECSFKAIRSSGAGGQHVNKVASKVELTFNLMQSQGLSETEKHTLQATISNKLTKENVIILQCSESRSQHKNKELVSKRLLKLLTFGLKVPKKRIQTKIPKSVIRKRLKHKKMTSDKKKSRQKPATDF
ncbi:MAG: alternative ribosome rescue aminoacyl-tRNA hydrolase ArfB [Flavobacteriaceae bacterium]